MLILLLIAALLFGGSGFIFFVLKFTLGAILVAFVGFVILISVIGSIGGRK